MILLRAGLFMVFANSIWALLPLVARTRLHLGSGGYGLLLGGVGIGAVAGAAALPRLRARVSPGALMTAGTLVFAAVTLALAYVRVSALAALALVIGGVAWILVLSTLNSQYQTTLPGWAKARGMSYYLVVFQGGGALGSAVFGILAQDAGLTRRAACRRRRTRACRPRRRVASVQGDLPQRSPACRRLAGPATRRRAGAPTGRCWLRSSTGRGPGASRSSSTRSTPGATPDAARAR